MLGKAALISKKDTEVSIKRKETDDFFAAFQHQATPEQQVEEIEEVIDIEIWESNINVFEIFLILRNHFREYYALDTFLLERLIVNRKLDLEEVLTLIPYIHATYVDKIMPKQDKIDG